MTYIYHKDSTLWAFEGPEKDHFSTTHALGTSNEHTVFHQDMYDREMSTARESALPVVNYIDVAILIGDKCYSRTLSPQIEFKKEPVALPGWGLEKVHLNAFFNEEKNQHVLDYAYRLVRSEPDGIEMNHAVVDEFTKPTLINLTVYSQKLWHSDKPFPVVPKYDGKDWESREYRNYLEDCKVYKYAVPRWLSTAYEVVNPEVIPWTPGGFERCFDGDQITLPEGYGILIRYKVATSTKDYIMIWCTKEQYDESPGFERQIVATITLPEKPSFKEMFEKSSLFKNIEKPENSANGAIQTATGVSLPFVEPSESQEESGLQQDEEGDAAHWLNKFTNAETRIIELEEENERLLQCIKKAITRNPNSTTYKILTKALNNKP